MRCLAWSFVVLGIVASGCSIDSVPAPLANEDGGGGSGGARAGTGGSGGTDADGGLSPCALNNGGCNRLAGCTVVAGKATCGKCPEGTEDINHDGTACPDIDECELGIDDCDENPPATCMNVNVPGRFLCRCPLGSEDQNPEMAGRECGGDGFGACSGPNDCDTEPNACTDVDGVATCACPDGYTDVNGDGSDCQDIDECDLGAYTCDDDPFAPCVNTVGGYRCDCPDGLWGAPGGNCVPQTVRVALGEAHACVILDGGVVKCWGGNFAGQLGVNNTIGVGALEFPAGTILLDLLPVTDLGRPALMLAAACSHTCALLDDGTVKCWGSNFSGQLGQNDIDNRGDGAPRVDDMPAQEMGDNLLPVDLGEDGALAVSITAGCEYSCALLENGKLKCWGGGPGAADPMPHSNYGQLGQGNTECLGDGVDELDAPADEMGDNLPEIDVGGSIVKIDGGYRFMCAILTGGAVKCWGRNSFGQLGQGTFGEMAHLGDQPGEMGDLLPAIPLGTGRSAVALAAGYTHVCALLDDSSVKCWGGEYNGGNLTGVGLDSPGNMGDEPGEMGDMLPPIDIDGDAISIATGYHSCAVLGSGAVKCWGQNDSGQLGLGDTEVRGDEGALPGETSEMGAALPEVELGTDRTAVLIEASQQYTCALLDDGWIKCWGRNRSGQLGIGSTSDRGDQPDEMGDLLPAAIDLW